MRTFLLWALAVVWFSEMALWAIRPLSEWWTVFWQQLPPDDPQLTSALYLTHALEACAKGALGVLAIFALRSGSPSVRSALFVPMASVPPLNLAFQFRAQGFPLGPTTVGAVLSAILWGSFFSFRDPVVPAPVGIEAAGPPGPTRPATVQRAMLGATGVLLTLAASMFLFVPRAGLRLVFPCLSAPLASAGGVPPGLTHSLMAVGTHVSAVTLAIWIAATNGRIDPTVRRAAAASSATLLFLVALLPLRGIGLELGRACASSSVLVLAIPLLAAWAIHGLVSDRAVGGGSAVAPVTYSTVQRKER